jgi:O-antigen/teichoic acid export membrane protein
VTQLRNLVSKYVLPSVIVTAGNGFAYLFQVVAARMMLPADYGAFNSLFGLAMALLAPATILPLIISRMVIETRGAGQGAATIIVTRFLLGSVVAAIAILLVAAGVQGWLRELLKIDSAAAILATFLFVVLMILCQIPVGQLQGIQQYIPMSVMLAIIPFFRMAAGVAIFVAVGATIETAMAACIAGAAIGFGYGLYAIGSIWRFAQSPIPPQTWRSARSFLGVATAASLILLAFGNIDIALVRAVTSPVESGYYAAASVLAKIAVLLPGPLLNMIFPEATAISTNSAADRGARVRLIFGNLAASAAVAFSVAALLTIFAEPVLLVSAGRNYLPAAPLVLVTSLAMASLAVIQLLTTYALAVGGGRFLVWPLGAALAAFILIPQFVKLTVMGVALLLLGTIVFALVAGLIWLLITHLLLHVTYDKAS